MRVARYRKDLQNKLIVIINKSVTTITANCKHYTHRKGSTLEGGGVLAGNKGRVLKIASLCECFLRKGRKMVERAKEKDRLNGLCNIHSPKMVVISIDRSVD